MRAFRFRFLYTSRHFVSISAIQEERNAVLTSVGCWRYLKLGLGSFGSKELEEGHRVTDWPIRQPRGVCRQGAGRTVSQSFRTGVTGQPGLDRQDLAEILRANTTDRQRRLRANWIDGISTRAMRSRYKGTSESKKSLHIYTAS